jgi:hypothetical protein
VEYLIPIRECLDAYDMMASLSLPADVLPRQLSHLLFVTFHIQVGMGFLGIHFLRQEQSRRNMLVRMDVATDEDNAAAANGKQAADPAAAIMERSRKFQRSAIPFIFRTALPYMLQVRREGTQTVLAVLHVPMTPVSFRPVSHTLVSVLSHTPTHTRITHRLLPTAT